MKSSSRNALCPCGSGRKIKHCHPYLAPFSGHNGSLSLSYSHEMLNPVIPAFGSEHRVLIMAGGEGSRWSQNDPLIESVENSLSLPGRNKLLVPINGQPLLHRTLEQLRRAGIRSPWIYNINDDLPDGSQRFTPREHRIEITDALAESKSLWDKPVTILLGDVVWSSAALTRLLEAHPVPWRFFGKLGRNKFTGKPWGEIYALRFCQSHAERILGAIHTLDSTAGWRKKLWELYRVMLGIPIPQTPPGRRYIMQPPGSRHFCELPDWTDDIDQLSDYHNIRSYLHRKPLEAEL